LTLGAGRASADLQIQYYDLTSSNISQTGPYAQVKVDLVDSTHATITFDSLTNGGFTYLFAGGGGVAMVGANITGSFTLSSFSGTPYQSPGGTISDGGTGQLDGFGSFTQSLNDSASGPSNAFTEVTLSVTANTGTTWSAITGVGGLLTTNNQGEILAVHIGALASGNTTSFTTTGDAAGATPINPPVHPSPEPSTMALSALGMLGFLAYGLRRRSK